MDSRGLLDAVRARVGSGPAHVLVVEDDADIRPAFDPGLRDGGVHGSRRGPRRGWARPSTRAASGPRPSRHDDASDGAGGRRHQKPRLRPDLGACAPSVRGRDRRPRRAGRPPPSPATDARRTRCTVVRRKRSNSGERHEDHGDASLGAAARRRFSTAEQCSKQSSASGRGPRSTEARPGALDRQAFRAAEDPPFDSRYGAARTSVVVLALKITATAEALVKVALPDVSSPCRVTTRL